VRNPRAGQYVFSVHANGGANSADFWRDVFLKHFTCRLEVFGYADTAKDPLRPRVFAQTTITPGFSRDKAVGGGVYQKFELAVTLRSQDSGAFQLSRGIGVSIIVEKTSPGELDWPARGAAASAFVRIDDVDLRFLPRPRDDNVQV
jgi:hypothetical protein